MYEASGLGFGQYVPWKSPLARQRERSSGAHEDYPASLQKGEEAADRDEVRPLRRGRELSPVPRLVVGERSRESHEVCLGDCPRVPDTLFLELGEKPRQVKRRVAQRRG